MESWSCELEEFPEFICHDLEFIGLQLQSQAELEDLTPDLLSFIFEKREIWHRFLGAKSKAEANLDLNLNSLALNIENLAMLQQLVVFLDFYEQSLPYLLTALRHWQTYASDLALTLPFRVELRAILHQELQDLLADLPESALLQKLLPEAITKQGLDLGFVFSLRKAIPQGDFALLANREAVSKYQPSQFLTLALDYSPLRRVILAWQKFAQRYFADLVVGFRQKVNLNINSSTDPQQAKAGFADAQHSLPETLAQDFFALLALGLKQDKAYLYYRLGSDLASFFSSLNLLENLEQAEMRKDNATVAEIEADASLNSTRSENMEEVESDINLPWRAGIDLQILTNCLPRKQSCQSRDLRGILAWQSQANSDKVRFRLSLAVILRKFSEQTEQTNLVQFYQAQRLHYISILDNYLCWSQQKLQHRLSNLNFDYQAQAYTAQQNLKYLDFSSLVEQKLASYQNSLLQQQPTLVDEWQLNLPIEVSKLLRGSPLTRFAKLFRFAQQSQSLHPTASSQSSLRIENFLHSVAEQELGIAWLSAQQREADLLSPPSCLGYSLLSKPRAYLASKDDPNHLLLSYEFLLKKSGSFSRAEYSSSSSFPNSDYVINPTQPNLFTSLDFLASLKRFRQARQFLTLKDQQNLLNLFSQKYGVLAEEEFLDLQTLQALKREESSPEFVRTEKNNNLPSLDLDFNPVKVKLATANFASLRLNPHSPWQSLHLTEWSIAQDSGLLSWLGKSLQSLTQGLTLLGKGLTPPQSLAAPKADKGVASPELSTKVRVTAPEKSGAKSRSASVLLSPSHKHGIASTEERKANLSSRSFSRTWQPLRSRLPQLYITRDYGIFTLAGCLPQLYQASNQQSNSCAISDLNLRTNSRRKQNPKQDSLLVQVAQQLVAELPAEGAELETRVGVMNHYSATSTRLPPQIFCSSLQGNLGSGVTKSASDLVAEYAVSPLKLLAPHASLLLLARENQILEANSSAELKAGVPSFSGNSEIKHALGSAPALASSLDSQNQLAQGLNLSQAFADLGQRGENLASTASLADFVELTSSTRLELGWLAKLGVQLSELDYQQIGFCFIYDKALTNSKLSWENKQLMRALQDALLSPLAVWNEFVTNLAEPAEAGKASLVQRLADPQAVILDLKFSEFKPNLLDLHQASFKPELVVNKLAFRTRIGYLFWQSLLESLQQISQALSGQLSWEFVNPTVNFKSLYLATYSLYNLTAEEKAWLNYLEEYYQEIISTVITNSGLV